MQCHYCDRDAVYAAEKDAVRVGLCEDHFQQRMEELADSDELEALRERIDVERADN
ncbi:MAG: DUF6757 family protein [Halolamina sp.]